jgi:hypothetical protein
LTVSKISIFTVFTDAENNFLLKNAVDFFKCSNKAQRSGYVKIVEDRMEKAGYVRSAAEIEVRGESCGFAIF